MTIHRFVLGRWLSPSAELTGHAVAPFTVLADKSPTSQAPCAHWHDIAIYPFQGVGQDYVFWDLASAKLPQAPACQPNTLQAQKEMSQSTKRGCSPCP